MSKKGKQTVESYTVANGLSFGSCVVCSTLKRFGFRCPKDHGKAPHPKKPPVPQVVLDFIEKRGSKPLVEDIKHGSLPDFRIIGR